MQTENEIIKLFNQQLSNDERRLMDGLNSPAQVQAFLNETSYPGGEENRSALEVLRQRQAHCLDGGLFAAAALRRIGYPAQIVDLLPEAGLDDDHVLALFQVEGYWGAVAKSNYSGLRFREAIHRSLRELVLSYFDDFFNLDGVKTLRAYTRVIRLNRFDHLNWMTTSTGVDAIEQSLKKFKLIPLISPTQAAQLAPVDNRSFEAGILGINRAGAYIPRATDAK